MNFLHDVPKVLMCLYPPEIKRDNGESPIYSRFSHENQLKSPFLEWISQTDPCLFRSGPQVLPWSDLPRRFSWWPIAWRPKHDGKTSRLLSELWVFRGCTYVCLYIHIYIYTYTGGTYMCIYICVYMYNNMYICKSVNVNLSIYIIYIYIYWIILIYIYIISICVHRRPKTKKKSKNTSLTCVVGGYCSKVGTLWVWWAVRWANCFILGRRARWRMSRWTIDTGNTRRVL